MQSILIQQTIITEAACNSVGWKAKKLIHGNHNLIHFHVLITGAPRGVSLQSGSFRCHVCNSWINHWLASWVINQPTNQAPSLYHHKAQSYLRRWHSPSKPTKYVSRIPKCHSPLHISLILVHTLSQINPVPNYFKNHFKIIFPSTSGSSTWLLTRRFSERNSARKL